MAYETPSPFPCAFCEYIAGRLPCQPVDANEHAVAFINLRQRSHGSILVASRRHASVLTALDAEEALHVMALVQRMSRAVVRAFNPDGLHVFCNAGRLAGQSEAHVHFQVIPRYEGQDYSFAASATYPVLSLQKRQEIADAIRLQF
jgi:histidine triad (HIT) family protein